MNFGAGSQKIILRKSNCCKEGIAVKKYFVVLSALCLLASCQEKPRQNSELMPGEVNDPRYPVPIICAVVDTACTDSVQCPAKTADCETLNFTVQKDTIYFLTVSYFNGDTINASCRACGEVYDGNTVVMQRVTACPTGGPWVDFGRLRPGVQYTLVVSLQRCPALKTCDCGKGARADAIVSIRRVFD